MGVQGFQQRLDGVWGLTVTQTSNPLTPHRGFGFQGSIRGVAKCRVACRLPVVAALGACRRRASADIAQGTSSLIRQTH